MITGILMTNNKTIKYAWQFAVSLIFLSANAVWAEGLKPVDDKELSSIYGGSGLTIDLSFQLNADTAGNLVGTPVSIEYSTDSYTHVPVFDGSGNPVLAGNGQDWTFSLGNDGYVEDLDNTSVCFYCREGIGGSQRQDWSYPGYLVIEDAYGAMSISGLTLDVDGGGADPAHIELGLPDLDVAYFQVGNISVYDDTYPTLGTAAARASVGGLILHGQINMGGSINVWAH